MSWLLLSITRVHLHLCRNVDSAAGLQASAAFKTRECKLPFRLFVSVAVLLVCDLASWLIAPIAIFALRNYHQLGFFMSLSNTRHTKT